MIQLVMEYDPQRPHDSGSRQKATSQRIGDARRGSYYHPDHLAVQRATTAAFLSSGMMGCAAPERIFYGAMLRDVFQGLAEKSRGRGIVGGLDPDVFGTASDMIAVSFDAAPFVQRKFLAIAAHRSAFGVTEEMLSSPPPGARELLDAFRPVFEREVFLLGGTRMWTPHWPLRDLLDGIDSAGLSCPSGLSESRPESRSACGVSHAATACS